MAVTITGASDDTVSVRGDVDEEWGAGENDRRLVTLSTGHVFDVKFGDNGWEVRLLVGDGDHVRMSKGGHEGDDDIAAIDQDVTWVVCADRLEKAR